MNSSVFWDVTVGGLQEVDQHFTQIRQPTARFKLVSCSAEFFHSEDGGSLKRRGFM
jgi:hypothetical protein